MKFRRHHNNKGYKTIKSEKLKKQGENIMKATRIFKVTYLYDFVVNGKITDRNLTGYYKTVATDAGDAIMKSRTIDAKPYKFKDGKKVKEVEYKNFRAMEVILLAETD